MILKNKDRLLFFTFPNLSIFKDIRHGIFTRNHGFSTGDYTSLNASIAVGDNKSSVSENRNAIARCMKSKELVFANQVHKTGILVFKKNDISRPAAAGSPPLPGDAMITNIPGKFLAVQVADCQAILLYDNQNKVVAGIHSGWRGSIKNILGACIHAMKSEFKCRPENIYAGISPSLGPCCSEFIHYQKEIPEKYWCYQNRSHYFNFWEISFHQLTDAGLLPKNIEISNICTKCNAHLFYSFRKKNHTGRFAAVIGLK